MVESPSTKHAPNDSTTPTGCVQKQRTKKSKYISSKGILQSKKRRDHIRHLFQQLRDTVGHRGKQLGEESVLQAAQDILKQQTAGNIQLDLSMMPKVGELLFHLVHLLFNRCVSFLNELKNQGTAIFSLYLWAAASVTSNMRYEVRMASHVVSGHKGTVLGSALCFPRLQVSGA